jgi:hypothetical protein
VELQVREHAQTEHTTLIQCRLGAPGNANGHAVNFNRPPHRQYCYNPDHNWNLNIPEDALLIEVNDDDG